MIYNQNLSVIWISLHAHKVFHVYWEALVLAALAILMLTRSHQSVFRQILLDQTKIVKKKINKKIIASAGNRTRAARVAGEHSTTEPPMLMESSSILLFISDFASSFIYKIFSNM